MSAPKKSKTNPPIKPFLPEMPSKTVYDSIEFSYFDTGEELAEQLAAHNIRLEDLRFETDDPYARIIAIYDKVTEKSDTLYKVEMDNYHREIDRFHKNLEKYEQELKKYNAARKHEAAKEIKALETRLAELKKL